MWSSLLVLALLATINPLRLGVILLIISRPRPLQSLFSYWAGCLISGLATLLVPLLSLHATPTSASFVEDFSDPAGNSTARYIAIGMGVLALSIAALMVLRSAARQRAPLPTARGASPLTPRRGGNGNTATLTLEPNTLPVISRLLNATQDAAVTEGGSSIRRLLVRVRHAWDNGSWWIAFVIGLLMVPPLDGVLFVLAIIVTSGTPLGMQVSAAVAYVIGMLAIEEIILVGSLAAPARTQAVLRLLHDWALAHHRKLLITFFAVVGLWLVARGMG